MIRSAMRLVSLCCLLAPMAHPYGRIRTETGAALHRSDFAGLQLELNAQAAPGLLNSAGQVFITADSDVMAAAAAAANSWNAVQTSAARFRPLQVSDSVNVANDGHTAIVFLDTPAIRSALLPTDIAVAVPTWRTGGDGTMLDCDVIFNPAFAFSTTGAENTYDIQSILTHEMGHVLGSGHSGIVGAAMFQGTSLNSTIYRTLAADDIAYVSEVYPAAEPSPFGTILGTLSQNGAPLRSVLVNAIDTLSGTAVSALTNALDGTFSMVTPPGTYVIFAQPLVGNIQPGNLYLHTDDAVDVTFNAGFLGGNAMPGNVVVTAGNISNADFSPLQVTNSAISLQYFNTAMADGFADQGRLFGTARPQTIVSGQTIDFVMLGQGIDTTLTDANVMLLGPLTLKPGSFRADAYIDSVSKLPYMRMTVNVAAVTAPTTATLIIFNNGSLSSFTGGLILLPPPPPPAPPVPVEATLATGPYRR